MAYYAAVISLQQTIDRLLCSSKISILPSSREILQFAYERVCSLQQVLQKLESSRNSSSEMVDSLRVQIREAAYKLEDAVEFHVSGQILSLFGRLGDEGSNSLILYLDLDEVIKQEIHYFADMVKKMEDECSKQLDLELSNSLPEEDDVGALRIDSGGMESKMVGLSGQFRDAKRMLLLDDSDQFYVFSLTGMAGIGKTTLAKKLYQDPEVSNHFNCRLWVTIGPKFQLRKIMLHILAQLDYDIARIQMESDVELGEYLCKSLESKRNLIVLDDVWDIEVRGKLYKYLPHKNGSRVLQTTRLQHVARQTCVCSFPLPLLNKEESWCLLREKVFGEELCSLQLEKAGEKIAEHCDGLPLLIVTVADLLSKADKTLEYWNKVANRTNISIFREANDKISNILLKSYKYLPQHLKPCFLYMGAFPPKCMIPTSKLFNLWDAEDLLESKHHADHDCLKMLVLSNVVLEKHETPTHRIRTCSLHSSFWHACVKQSWKETFLHVISSPVDISNEGLKSQRRLCTYNNVLFGIKEVYSSIKSISSARSLICSGPYHKYPVPISFGLRLLKVLDVLSVRFYKFPIGVLELIYLRYLALTYNGKVPPSISKLWNLEYLIVSRHLNIKFLRDWSYLPVEIWNMQKLRHLRVMGSCLPYFCDILLPHLLKLSDVSAHSCTKEILERIPNLQKLGIQIELVPDATEPLSCFDHLSHLNKLESLKCVIVNPNPPMPQLVAPPNCISCFPSCLRKLSLSEFGYPWEYIHTIAKLPRLEVLKLRSCAFRGLEWAVQEADFIPLKVLLLEDIDLVYLSSNGPCFQNLTKLVISHCYKLKKISLKLGRYVVAEVTDSPLVANYIHENGGRGVRDLIVHSTWDDEKPKTKFLRVLDGMPFQTISTNRILLIMFVVMSYVMVTKNC